MLATCANFAVLPTTRASCRAGGAASALPSSPSLARRAAVDASAAPRTLGASARIPRSAVLASAAGNESEGGASAPVTPAPASAPPTAANLKPFVAPPPLPYPVYLLGSAIVLIGAGSQKASYSIALLFTSPPPVSGPLPSDSPSSLPSRPGLRFLIVGRSVPSRPCPCSQRWQRFRMGVQEPCLWSHPAGGFLVHPGIGPLRFHRLPQRLPTVAISD